jgi:ubiquitin C-terminal hydrolase
MSRHSKHLTHDTMFGLRNKNGSCWINAALQGVFRIPDLQTRFREDEDDTNNPVESCLAELWGSRGEEGLNAFYQCVKVSPHMPAGEDIGDSHELLKFLWDKVPVLDKLVRYKVAHITRCIHCGYALTNHDSVTEFTVAPTKAKQSISETIAEAVQPQSVPDWTCDTCKQKGCTRQLLLGTFPQVFVFHVTSPRTTVSYSAQLVLNNQTYALFAVICFNGGHWYTFGRNLPPGQPWAEYNDATVRTYDATFFPLADTMRLLMYYRIQE